MTTLAIDPGDTTGIAIIGSSGELLWERQLPHDDFVDMLAGSAPDKVFGGAFWLLFNDINLVVVENFQLLPAKARAVSQKASRNVTAARGIGAVDLWARARGIELVYRSPAHWRIGLQLAGIEQSEWPKSHKDGHYMCAYGAGYHALVALGLVSPRIPA